MDIFDVLSLLRDLAGRGDSSAPFGFLTLRRALGCLSTLVMLVVLIFVFVVLAREMDRPRRFHRNDPEVSTGPPSGR